MKKSKWQAIVEFASQLSQIRDNRSTDPKPQHKTKKKTLKQGLIALTLFLFTSQAFAYTYYSRTNGGLWTSNTTWSTSGYGGFVNIGTYPKSGDIVYIGNGYTIYINASVNCASIIIGQGVSGNLEYRNTGSYSLFVSGSVTVNTGAKFRYTGATAVTSNLLLGGNFSNYGEVDFYNGVSQVVNTTFLGAGNSIVTGNGIWDVNTVTLTKTSSTAQLTVYQNAFETSIKSFTGIKGSYIHYNSGTYSINPTPGTFTIGPYMKYYVPQGTMWFASAASDVVLQGALYVNGGTVKIGSTSGTQGLRSDRNGTFTPYLSVTGGSLQVYGGITYGGASGSEPFSFYMTGGSVNLNSGTTGTNRQVFYVNDVAGSSFYMSGGIIYLEKPNITGSTIIDFAVPGTSGTVNSNGGFVYFGTNNTANGSVFNFKPYANVVQPNFRITGNTSRSISLRPSFSSTSGFKIRSLYIDIGKIFDIRSISGTTGDTRTMTLTSNCDGVNALYNLGTFTARSSTVTFNPSGAQAIGGSSITYFYNLSINNGSGITLNRTSIVTNYLSMVSGKLNTSNANILFLQANANANLGSSTSFVNGPMIQTVATASAISKTFPIGCSNAFRPVVLTVQHTNATSVTYRGEVFNNPASSLPFALPASIANVSNVRYARFIRSNVANFSTGSIQMYYDTDDGVADKNTLLVAHDNGTNLWQDFGGTATANWTGNIVSASFNNFHTYFALGNPPGGGNPLPIELASFHAKLVNKKVNLDWATYSEVNNAFFTVERSADNVQFTQVGTVDGAGNSTTLRTYALTDEQPLRGTSYYRLKQTDYDGRSEYFPVQVISNIVRGSLSVWPNPALDKNIHISYTGTDLENYAISVQDITGKVIPSSVEPDGDGSLKLDIDENYLHKGGIFIVTASDGKETLRQRLMIQ